jgi:hypothetical protein
MAISTTFGGTINKWLGIARQMGLVWHQPVDEHRDQFGRAGTGG